MTEVVQSRYCGDDKSSEHLTFVSGLSHGVRIRGRLPEVFQNYLWLSDTPQAAVAPDLDVSYQIISVLPEVDELWVDTHDDPHPESRFSLFRQSEGFGLKVECQGRGLFRITSSSIQIEWLPDGTGAAHYFFCHALPLWLELNGIPVLHASAVSFGGRAVAFVGQSGEGKSTLCNTLVRLGGTFIADDGLALSENAAGNWQCFPGPPLYRLWPSALAHHTGTSVEHLPRIHKGFEKRLLPLRRRDAKEAARVSELFTVYVLERRVSTSGDIELLAYTGSESLVRLVEFSLVQAPAAALGWTVARLQRLARLTESIRVKRLVYPSGAAHWERIRDTVTEDLDMTS